MRRFISTSPLRSAVCGHDGYGDGCLLSRAAVILMIAVIVGGKGLHAMYCQGWGQQSLFLLLLLVLLLPSLLLLLFVVAVCCCCLLLLFVVAVCCCCLLLLLSLLLLPPPCVSPFASFISIHTNKRIIISTRISRSSSRRRKRREAELEAAMACTKNTH